MKQANRPEDALVLGMGKNLLSGLAKLGQEAVNEVTRLANKQGVHPDSMPYVWWALTTKAGLPLLERSPDYALLLALLEGTGTLPDYTRNFAVLDDPVVDEAINKIAAHLVTWASKTMKPRLLLAYQAALKSQVGKVQRATGGRVPKGKEVAFLRRAFGQILTLRSRWFEEGELLRRVVRSLPV